MASNEELIKQIRAGGNRKELMTELWKQNEGLIKKIIDRYISPVLSRDTKEDKTNELIQQSYIGFDRAVNSFEDSQGVKFSTWVYRVVPQEINRYLTDCTHTIRIPVNLAAEVAKYKRIVNIFEKESGREPTDFEASKLLNVNVSKIESMRAIILQSQLMSLDEPPKDAEDKTLKLADIIPSDIDNIEDATRAYDYEIMKKDLDQALEGINPNYSSALRKRYLDGMTCVEIGKKKGISTSRVAEQCKKGIAEIKRFRQRNSLKRYYEIYLSATSIRHVGVNTFNRTWTSSTESIALHNVERDIEKEEWDSKVSKIQREVEEMERKLEEKIKAERQKEIAEMWGSSKK